MTEKIKKVLMGIAALTALAFGGATLAGAASGGKDTAAQERTQAAGDREQGEGSEAAEGKESENSAADPDDVQDENGKDDATEASEKGGEEESDQPVDGAAASRAKEAAAAETGGKPGTVERDSEKGATYEVEVTKPGGKQADVRLDDQFKVVAVDEDTEQDEAGVQDQTGEQDQAGAQDEADEQNEASRQGANSR